MDIIVHIHTVCTNTSILDSSNIFAQYALFTRSAMWSFSVQKMELIIDCQWMVHVGCYYFIDKILEQGLVRLFGKIGMCAMIWLWLLVESEVWEKNIGIKCTVY